MRVIVVLEVVDNRAVVELAQEEGRPEAAVADDQIWAEPRRLARLIGRVRVPDRVLKGAGAVVVGPSGPPAQVKTDAPDALAHASGATGDEHAVDIRALGQPGGDRAELCREVRVDEEDLHGQGALAHRWRGLSREVDDVRGGW